MPANLTLPALNVDKMEHAFLGGSTAGTWMRCTGAPGLWRTIGQVSDSTPAAAEGTALHRVMEELIKPRIDPRARYTGPAKLAGRPYEPDDMLGTLVTVQGHPEPVEITGEHVEYLRYALDVVETIIDGADAVFLERKVWPHIQGGQVSEVFGYVDLAALRYRKSGTFKLYVVDFKFGWERVASETHQLRYYAVGMVDALAAIGTVSNRPIGEVETVIVQPKLRAVESSVYSPDDLAAFGAEIEDAYLAQGLGGALTPGPEQCRWCKAKPVCPALRQALTEFPDEPPEFTPDDFPRLLAKAELALSAAVAVRQAALRFIGNGGRIPGFKAVVNRRTSTWKGKGEAAAAKLKERGVPEKAVYKQMVRTPKQLARIKGVNMAAHADLVKVSETFALVPETDKREAIVPKLGFEDAPDLEAEEASDEQE